jgi:hypothetical protein
MNRAYIFSFSPLVGTMDQVKAYLDSLPQIKNWRFEMPNCFFLISPESAQTLVELILVFTKRNSTARFIIMEVGDHKQGWLTEEGWAFLNNKPVVK